ncbi:MAG TPA: nuclear transport factor 2 family protein [Gemmatimonadaceae bacterium]|nr:nuclear transport factor 2 family protein [Gemmatimonadaceae bacterium]
MRPSLTRLAIVLLALAAADTASAQQQQSADPDREAVRRAVLDYMEGFYEGDSTKLVRSVRPEVYKYGFSRQPDSTYRGMQMQWPQFHAFANRVKASGRTAPATAPREIVLFEVSDQTASAKLTAWWGIDYLLLARYGGRWMITHVLWQSPPLRSK